MPYLEIAVAFVFASAFMKGGEMEARSGRTDRGLLWLALSVLVSGLVVGLFARGVLWLIVAQLALFVAIGAVRVWLDDR